ncbi:MAG: alpha-amylase family glycosyl hydrolase [Planctomycetaceae bacterium]
MNLRLTAAALLFSFTALVVGREAAADSPPGAPFGAGPGAWPGKGAGYEVSLEYFPNHSFKELTAQLPRLEQLGVSVIYLTPVFRCLGNAQYLIVDNYAINRRYGTEADLRELAAEAHRRKIKVLLDFVTSITYDGTDIMQKHPDWVLKGKDGERQRYHPMPMFGWALDCTNPEVIDYFSKLARHYVEKFDIDGWRVDSPTNNYDSDKVAGDHSRLALLRSMRKAINEAKKDALLIAEISGPTVLFGKPDDTLEPLFDEMCEASYDYVYCGFLGGSQQSGYGYFLFDGPVAAGKFKPTALDAVAHNRLTSKEFVDSVKERRILYDRLRANFIENHDTERVAKAFPDQARALFLLSATIPGIPVIHAGQELGSAVHPDASGSRNVVVDWANGNQSTQAFYVQVMQARANHPAISRGNIRDVWSGGEKCLAYLRSADDDRVLVVLNFDSKPVQCEINLPAADGAQPAGSYELVDLISGEKSTKPAAELARYSMRLEPCGYKLIGVRPAR